MLSFSAGHAEEININANENSRIPENTVINSIDIPSEEFYRAKILEIINEGNENSINGNINEFQDVKALIINGNEKNKVIETRHGGLVPITQQQKVKPGDNVVLVKIYNADGKADYFINDHYRIQAIILIFIFFIALAVFFGRKKGVGSLLGLTFSVLVLAKFIVPRIIAGSDPIIITLIGALLIAVVSLFLAHGFNRRTVVALLSTILTFGIALGLSALFVELAHLFGRGSEETFFIFFFIIFKCLDLSLITTIRFRNYFKVLK